MVGSGEGKKPLVASVSFGGWKEQRAAGGSSAGQVEQTVTEPADIDRVQDSAMLLSTIRLSGGVSHKETEPKSPATTWTHKTYLLLPLESGRGACYL